MKTFQLKTNQAKILADTLTPVSIYLRLRDQYPNTFLLESSDYHGDENSYTYICCEPMAGFSVEQGKLKKSYPDGSEEIEQLEDYSVAVEQLSQFMSAFKSEDMGHKFISNGLFGYMTFDAVQYFEDIRFRAKDKDEQIPEIFYQAFRFVIAIDHFKNELYVFEHQLAEDTSPSRIDEILTIVKSRNYGQFDFSCVGEESSSFEDEEFLEVLKKGKEHCYRGDVFQVVLARRFQRAFKGDEFNVYRALRSINPSPYLFYFDYGSYKIFGSSPEAQLVIKEDKATIHPIAGTFRRTGNDTADAELAKELLKDPKENAEHVMLVDLARNDLSRNGGEVEVEVYREVQYYSHLIHLVSKVSGKLGESSDPIRVVADTFPAGTLSGAPKYRALEIIDENETVSRGYYGGAIGFLGFNGDFNHAIMIRSFLSQKNNLYFQAGAGVVAASSPESELQEVHNKLAALRNALELAETL
ncbi:anthranilate synthase component I family protein [Algivirga pacifica]|uniref:Anthranilate synthase component 1 n=1 Tax=Algivirga pacifica TaxID=1162670 RepID=A0ABP9DK90_9BACT